MKLLFLFLVPPLSFAGFIALNSQNAGNGLPAGFVYLDQVDPTILQDIRYATSENFTGRRVKGYKRARCILSAEAARQLAKAQHILAKQSLGIKVIDGYRPKQAVSDFMRWSQNARDQRMKAEYYPNVNKKDLFALEYIAPKSAHTRGSAVDITLVQLPSATELDMGTHVDFLDERSYSMSKNISPTAQRNRVILRSAMEAAGFKPTRTEWWHFSLIREPFPDTYFDFPVK